MACGSFKALWVPRFTFCFVYLFWFFKTGFLCSFRACPGTHSIDQAGLELTEICLALPPECWIKGVHHHRLASASLFKPSTQYAVHFEYFFPREIERQTDRPKQTESMFMLINQKLSKGGHQRLADDSVDPMTTASSSLCYCCSWCY